MTLKFPNARLFVHDLLSTGYISGPEAIATSACEFGLIQEEASDKVQQLTGSEKCRCMAAARNVVNEYFTARAKAPGVAEVNVDEVWSAVEKEVESYKKKVNIHQPAEEYRCDSKTKSGDCLKFTPPLFDLVLQQLRRYP